ncbi:MAG: Rieske (2Fe-2S) protein, partial [Dongiaceae bacterium]
MTIDQGVIWPKDDFSRVPYRVFADQSVFDREQERIFNGPVWCYLALEAEIPNPGDFKTSFVGNTSVVVNRAKDGSL